MLKTWFISLVAAAMIVACADTLLAKSGQRAVGRLAGTLMLLLVVLGPLLSLGGVEFGTLSEELMAEMEQKELHLQAGSEEILKEIIEERFRTYILDKAAQLEVTCSASVECKPDGNGLWLPERVSVTGNMTPQKQRQLEQLIQQELGVAPDRQYFTGGD